MAKPSKRDADLRRALEARRREMHQDVRERLRDSQDHALGGGHDAIDASDANFRQAIDMTLLQMKATALASIDEALRRLEAGQYGWCAECEGHISEARLRALPLAVRCRACAETRERELTRANVDLRRDAPFSHATI